jgi:hypothetical protein
MLAKKVTSFSDGEIIKECLEAVTDVAFPDKNNIIQRWKKNRGTGEILPLGFRGWCSMYDFDFREHAP